MGGPWLKNMSPDERALVEAKRHEDALARGRDSYSRNRETRRVAQQSKYAASGEQLRTRARQRYDRIRDRIRKLKPKYGITITGWLALFYFQGERCRCCGATDPGSVNGWSTDHDHETRKLRGIVCVNCNRLLGALGDTLVGVRDSCARFTRYLETT